MTVAYDPRMPALPSPDLRAVELAELRTFCAAAELGTLGRAAVRCRISQPAVSKRLAALEQLAGARLLDRSPRGVKLTPAGRRLYEEAHRLLVQADAVDRVLGGLRRGAAPLRLAASHSATDAFVGAALATTDEAVVPIELVSANSQAVRDIIADGRADVGVVASRLHHTPYPGVRELPLADDEVICAVPDNHPWALRPRPIPQAEFLRTPMVVRDPASNARWTVEGTLRDAGLPSPPVLAEASTPHAARSEALDRCAPVLLSWRVLAGHGFHRVAIRDLRFPRAYLFVLPAVGEPGADVVALMGRLRTAADEMVG